ncbi:MAG: hypothetical protein PHY04_03945 [Candidatus ainarchaeum sp.]|jgi:hypothetical protein|nr:hypothetical protein [Candidatus ainarchaeum sp.]MDD3086280.1 hypothetical protein [Candidatus ainarchaeum sp.]MDD4128860.1 hypothetical protein [Candidatus ainarchaeum sp.]MDD4468009.1 hypothetical protein [Candidatus ainarchaeum sp.]
MVENGKKNFVNKKAFRSRANDYTLSELEAFTRATYKAYLSVLSTKPDALIAPLRGSEPLVKVMNLYASEERKSNQMPRVFYPRLGQISLGEHGKVIDKTLPGFIQSQSEPEQVRELRRMLDSVLKRSRVDQKKRIHLVLIDEVRHGGSVAQAVEMIEGLIANKATKIPVSLSVIAIAENKAYRSASYNALKSRIHVKEFLVPRVFTMDSANSLFPLLKEKRIFWPFSSRLKLGITKKAIRGRQELLEDISALREKERLHLSNGRLENTVRFARLKKIPKIK